MNLWHKILVCCYFFCVALNAEQAKKETAEHSTLSKLDLLIDQKVDHQVRSPILPIQHLRDNQRSEDSKAYKKESEVKKTAASCDTQKLPAQKKIVKKKIVKKKIKKPTSNALVIKRKEQVEIKNNEPLIRSIKKELLLTEKLIILDAGHGGYDLGCKAGSCHEKSMTLSTTLMTQKILTEMGYRVLLTRSRDIFLTLKKRTEIANETKSKLFVSVHYNSAKNSDAKGIEVFYYKSEDKWRSGSSKKLADSVLSALIAKTGANNRGVKNGNFFVIRETKMPAILIEGGFITHEDERALIKDSQYREKIAKGIAEGIDRYFKA